MTFLSSFPQANLRGRKKEFCRIIPCFLPHSFNHLLASERKWVARERPTNSWDTPFKMLPCKCFGHYSLTTCGRVSTEAWIVSALRLRSKQRPPCYSGSQTAAGNQEKCAQATELVRPEAAMISDQSAARDEQKYASISGLLLRHRSCTTKKPFVSVFVKIILNKITQGADSG